MQIIACAPQADGRWRMEYAADRQEFTEALDTVYRQTRRNFNIAGYPNGRAPRAAIEAERGKDKFWLPAINYCLDNLFPSIYFSKLAQMDLHPLCWPEMELLEVNENGFKGAALISLIPKVSLPDDLNLRVAVAPRPVTAQMVGAEVEKLREKYADEVPLAPNEQASRGDVLLLDFEGTVGGVPFPDGTRKNYRLHLGKNQPFPGFYERLEHAIAGRTYQMQTTFPFYMKDEDLDGKTADFSIMVKAAFRCVPPASGLELAQRAGYADYEAMRQAIRAKLEQQQTQREWIRARKNLLEQFAAGVNCSLPETVVDSRRDELYLAFKQSCISRGVSYTSLIAKTGMTEEQYLVNLRKYAARQLAGTAGMVVLAQQDSLPLPVEPLKENDDEPWPTDGLTQEDRLRVCAAVRFLSQGIVKKGKL